MLVSEHIFKNVLNNLNSKNDTRLNKKMLITVKRVLETDRISFSVSFSAPKLAFLPVSYSFSFPKLLWQFVFGFGRNWLCGFGRAESGYQMLVKSVVTRVPSAHVARRSLYGTQRQSIVYSTAAAMQYINTNIRVMCTDVRHDSHCELSRHVDCWSWAEAHCRLRPNQCIVVKKALCYKAAANSRDTYKFVSMQFHANPI